MRKAYWPYRGVDSVCFCAEYGLVVLCLGLEAGKLSTRALGASQDQRTHQQSLRMRPSYRRTHRHPLSTSGLDEKGASSYSLIIMRTVFCTK